jgi:integrating conjugative element protein (TIGR03761 family)
MPGTTLLSDIRITLHTRIAIRLWLSQPTNMLLCLALLKRLLRAEHHDDPWATHWLTHVHIRLNVLIHLLSQKHVLLDRRFASLPAAIATSLSHNPNPAEFGLPLALISPPASRLVNILIDYDRLARRILLAWQLDLITQDEKKTLLAQIPRLIRQLSSYVHRFRTTGVTRDDIRHNTPLAQVVRRRLGELPKDILAETGQHAQ